MKKLLFVLIILYSFVSCKNWKHEYFADDIELWENTEFWDFAKCVSKNQFAKAEQLIRKSNIDVDYREPKYGETLLSWAILNDNVEAVKFLVDHGANPNIHNTFDGKSPMIDATGGFNAIEILEYLLLHGGNPNDYVSESENVENRSRETPLTSAALFSMEKTKMLVEAGADANFAVEEGWTAFNRATSRLDILEYLLLNCDFDYKKTYVVTVDTKDTLFLKELIKKDEVAYRQDSVRAKRILRYLEKKYPDYL